MLKILNRRRFSHLHLQLETFCCTPKYHSFISCFQNDDVTTLLINFTGEIQRVQGFVSQTVSLVDTTPIVEKQAAIEIIVNKWKHSQVDRGLVFKVKEPRLEILQSVSYNINIMFMYISKNNITDYLMFYF